MVLRHLNQGRDSMFRVQIQVKPFFYNLGCGFANVTIAHSPLIPEAPQSQPPQPAPSHDPSERQRLLTHQGAGYCGLVTSPLLVW